MKINIKHVAKLANLDIKENEMRKLEDQLSSILDYIEKLKTVNTMNVAETSQTTDLENITREDLITASLSQEEAISATSNSYNGLFKVKAILK